jgi:hypothetical protein
MRMSRIAALFFIICSYLVIVACAGNPLVIVSKDDQEKVCQIPGAIELTLAEGRNIWFYSLKKGVLSLKHMETNLPFYLTEHPRILFQKDVPTDWPKIQGHVYMGAYSMSPDRSHMAISLSSAEDGVSSTDIAIVRLDTKEIVFQTNDKIFQDISDITWSTDSKRFAVLHRRYKRIIWPPRYLFYLMLAHPADSQTYFLSVYDLKGNLFVKAKVASNIIGGMGQIVWKSE